MTWLPNFLSSSSIIFLCEIIQFMLFIKIGNYFWKPVSAIVKFQLKVMFSRFRRHYCQGHETHTFLFLSPSLSWVGLNIRLCLLWWQHCYALDLKLHTYCSNVICSLGPPESKHFVAQVNKKILNVSLYDSWEIHQKIKKKFKPFIKY